MAALGAVTPRLCPAVLRAEVRGTALFAAPGAEPPVLWP